MNYAAAAYQFQTTIAITIGIVADLSYSALRVFRYKSTLAGRIVGLRNQGGPHNEK
jgi:hypothetical protein